MNDTSNSFGQFDLRLYVAGRTPNSQRAVKNLESITSRMQKDSYTVEILDLKDNFESANGDQVIAIPTLIRKNPKPEIRVIGDLSQLEKVLQELEIFLP